jgi:hypothetical protein
MSIAALKITDHIATPQADFTNHGKLHSLGFLLGVPSLTIAIELLGLSLRRNAAWESARRTLLGLAQLPWLSLAAMVVTIAVQLPRNGGKFGPAVFVGLRNRLYIAACCA